MLTAVLVGVIKAAVIVISVALGFVLATIVLLAIMSNEKLIYKYMKHWIINMYKVADDIEKFANKMEQEHTFDPDKRIG